jgi:hypothetical protein
MIFNRFIRKNKKYISWEWVGKNNIDVGENKQIYYKVDLLLQLSKTILGSFLYEKFYTFYQIEKLK